MMIVISSCIHSDSHQRAWLYVSETSQTEPNSFLIISFPPKMIKFAPSQISAKRVFPNVSISHEFVVSSFLCWDQVGKPSLLPLFSWKFVSLDRKPMVFFGIPYFGHIAKSIWVIYSYMHVYPYFTFGNDPFVNSVAITLAYKVGTGGTRHYICIPLYQ